MRSFLLAVLLLLGLDVMAFTHWSRDVAQAQPSAAAAQGQALAQARCAACHGAHGNRTVTGVPRLAGLSAGYLYRQARAYADGTRSSAAMAAILPALTANQLRAIAGYYARQVRGRDKPVPGASVGPGRALYRFGAPGVPACVACHAPGAGGIARGHGMMGPGGMMGMGRGAMMRDRVPAPDLFGQHAGYVAAQLQAFADGRRPGPLMGPIARAMTARQRQAVAAYVATHP